MIRKATTSDAAAVAALAVQMWPHHTLEELTADFAELIAAPGCAVFLLEEEQAIGFAQCQLRHDYVEGTSSSPVGYLEGIFVSPERRRCGHARSLLAACEAWAKEQGCSEFASDCELDNTDSLAFHLSLGFTEANRIICFAKKL